MSSETTQLERFAIRAGENIIEVTAGAKYIAITLEFTPADTGKKQGDWKRQSVTMQTPFIDSLLRAIPKAEDASNKVNAVIAFSKNLFDKSSIVSGYINTASGGISPNANSNISPIIPVTGGQMYYLSGRNCGQTELCFMDNKGNLLKPLDAESGQSKVSFALGY
jgi:hypothetical protein